MSFHPRLLAPLAAALACLALAPATAGAAEGSIFEALGNSSFLGTLTTQTVVGSTVPANGDLNPYGIVNVPRSEGSLVAGDTLVSNFNNNENQQGRGSTIVELSPGGALTLFAQIEASKLPGPCPGGVGLTTALTVLPGGFVVVGSLPSTNGTPATTQPGCLIVLDNTGHPVETIAGGPINGPWDMTAVVGPFHSTLYVTNVLNGTVAGEGKEVNEGTVVRIGLLTCCGRPIVTSEKVIATGFAERTDPVGFVRGPTGIAFERLPFGLGGLLFVVDAANSRISMVIEAGGFTFGGTGGGIKISQGGQLLEPVGMTLAPNGHILTTNSGNGDLVETTLAGKQLAPYNTHVTPDELFGLTLSPDGHGVLFVNDNANNVELAH